MSRTINYLTAFLVICLTVISMILSYDALWAVALSYGVPSTLAYLWPILIDGALVVFSLAVVRASLKEEKSLWPWFLVSLFTIATVTFNILHAPDDLTARVVAAVAPISLFLSFETLMAMLKAEAKRSNSAQSLVELARQINQRREELEARGEELSQRQVELKVIQEQIKAAKEAKKQEPKQQEIGQVKAWLPANLSTEQRQELVSQMAQSRLTNEQIADTLGVSLGTIKHDKKTIKEVSLNGKIAEPLEAK